MLHLAVREAIDALLSCYASFYNIGVIRVPFFVFSALYRASQCVYVYGKNTKLEDWTARFTYQQRNSEIQPLFAYDAAKDVHVYLKNVYRRSHLMYHVLINSVKFVKRAVALWKKVSKAINYDEEFSWVYLKLSYHEWESLLCLVCNDLYILYPQRAFNMHSQLRSVALFTSLFAYGFYITLCQRMYTYSSCYSYVWDKVHFPTTPRPAIKEKTQPASALLLYKLVI